MRDRKRRSKTKNGFFRSGFFDQKKKAIFFYLKKSYIFFSDRKIQIEKRRFFVFDLRFRSRIRSGLRVGLTNKKKYTQQVKNDYGVEHRILVINIHPVCVCVCFLPIYSARQVRWMYQPGSHRRKVTQDFSSTFLLRCMPLFFSREGFSRRSCPSSILKSNFVYF